MSNTATTTPQPAATTKIPKSAVTIKTDLPSVAAGATTARYWIGVMPRCPLQNITAGGIAFPLFRGDHLSPSGDLVPLSKRQHGIYVDVTPEMLTTIKEAVRLRVVRPDGVERDAGDDYEDGEESNTPKRKMRAHIVMRDSGKCRKGYKYTAQPGDVPMARFVYMHKLADISAEDIHSWPPHPMERPQE